MRARLNEQQERFAAMVRKEDGDFRVNIPIGTGRTLILIESVRDAGRVLYVSNVSEIRQQFAEMSALQGLTTVMTYNYVEARRRAVSFDTVILAEDVSDRYFSATRIIRC